MSDKSIHTKNAETDLADRVCAIHCRDFFPLCQQNSLVSSYQSRMVLKQSRQNYTTRKEIVKNYAVIYDHTCNPQQPIALIIEAL